MLLLANVLSGLGFLIVQYATPVAAQAYSAFRWDFADNFTDVEFQECQQIPLRVTALPTNQSSVGVPPYYLIAFESGGIPTTTVVGSDPNNLMWMANHKRGTELMLTVIDSNHSAGSIPNTMYTMTAGQDTSCIPTPPQDMAVITANVTDTLLTCDSWGLTFKGGAKPYTLVLSALNSTTITNVTLRNGDDLYTWIDRAEANSRLMASVVDANGIWGISSPAVRTFGSLNADCIGLVPSEGSTAALLTTTVASASPIIASTESAQATSSLSISGGSHSHAVVGLAVGLGVPLALAIAIIAWLLWRRNHPSDGGFWDRGSDGSKSGMREAGSPSAGPRMNYDPMEGVPVLSMYDGTTPRLPSPTLARLNGLGLYPSIAQGALAPVTGPSLFAEPAPNRIIQHQDAGDVPEFLRPPEENIRPLPSPPSPPMGASADANTVAGPSKPSKS